MESKQCWTVHHSGPDPQYEGYNESYDVVDSSRYQTVSKADCVDVFEDKKADGDSINIMKHCRDFAFPKLKPSKVAGIGIKKYKNLR